MRILLIEDDEKVARAVSTGLQAEHFAVDRASDGPEGLDAARLGTYDLIILDLMLPGLNGTELLKRLREVNTDVPVLILTARDAISEKIANFEAGADDYLTKPFAFAELVVRVNALLRRGATKRANIIRIADLEIDRSQHKSMNQTSNNSFAPFGGRDTT
jgi:DNA-binding response OmpR family regulator